MCNAKGVALGGARLFSVLTKMKSSADFFFLAVTATSSTPVFAEKLSAVRTQYLLTAPIKEWYGSSEVVFIQKFPPKCNKVCSTLVPGHPRKGTNGMSWTLLG